MTKEKTELDQAIEAVVLGRATKEQAEMYKKAYPAFQACGEEVPVYIPQRGKTVNMVILYATGPLFYVAAVRTRGVVVAYEIAYNCKDSQWVAFYRITHPGKL